VSGVVRIIQLADVVGSLLFRRPEEPLPASTVERLGEGVFHLDYDDPDRVYLVTVRQVPRIRLPLERPVVVGEAAGVRAQLVGVALANHIEVALDAEEGPSRQAGLSDFMARYEEWGRQAGREPPPSWPAEEFARIALSASDDVGTVYRHASGESGGSGTEWVVRRALLPTPPAQARRLTLHFSAPTGPPVDIGFPLPASSP
jgi:hypothetical protein